MSSFLRTLADAPQPARVCCAANVDKKAVNPHTQTIHGVSVITECALKGHDMFADATTLQQVQASARSFGEGGVKVKIEHNSGFGEIVGVLKSFRIDGKQLRADMHLIKAHPRAASVIELAQVAPTAFGLSIVFSGKHETIGGKKFARCSELYSVDLVDHPAANPSGLFSDPQTPLPPEHVADIASEVLHRDFENNDAARVAIWQSHLETAIPGFDVTGLAENHWRPPAPTGLARAMNAVHREQIKALLKHKAK